MAKHTIKAMQVGVNPRAIQQAFTSIAGPIIEAGCCESAYGLDEAKRHFGNEDGDLPKAGEVIIGRSKGLVVKLVVEPESGGYSGVFLEHEEVDGIGINAIRLDDGSLIGPHGEISS
ncbi:hypothetical protein [Halomonas getboli]|uniref:hypothetical protein n=1 Tax=Halomonas getboli TaxID=2935862 RepID=UPI001FFFCA51|nr:hypothetical protein [Halomonas getboli]MCK2183544.1 hypothetical protein [Halomonas getboli]